METSNRTGDGGDRRGPRRGVPLSVAMLVASLAGPVAAEEIAPFRLTGIDGYASVDYLSDSQSYGTPGGASNTYAISSLQESVFLNTHSYFYHPNFLKMDLGGGPLWVQNRVEENGLSRADRETLYNLTGRLSFLEQKPFPLVLYYEHLNPTVSTSLTQSFIQTNTKYGATWTLRQPLSPVFVVADVFRLRSEGESPTLIVDDQIDQASLRMSTSIGRDGFGQVMYQVSQQDSLGGVPALAIVPTTIENRIASLDTRMLFGANRGIIFSGYMSYHTLSFVRTDFTLVREDFVLSPDLQWRHSEHLTSFYNYNLYKSSEPQFDTTNQSARTGLIWRDGDNLMVSGDVHGEDSKITGLELQSYGAGLLASYTQPWTNAVLRLNAGAIYDVKDREAAVANINVIGERITLVNGIPVTLAQEFIDTTTIQVWNTARTQQYCPDVLPLPPGCVVADYRIIVIGTRTQIQRLATGNILDGQEVLVDYAFRTGGTITYNLFNQNYQASLTLYRYYTVFARYLDIDYRLTTGTPTLPLNPVRSTIYGFRVDQPVWQDFMVGGEASYEHHEEEVAPYRRTSYDAYLQLPVLFRIGTRLTGRRITADYLNSVEDIDLVGWAVQLRATPWIHTTFTAEAAYEEDTGGTLTRSVLRDIVALEWRLRQLSVRGDVQYAREEQGGFERERTVIRVLVRRDF